MVEALKPKDIWPCTVDKVNWSAAQSMSFLFGHLYETPCKFTHDQAMFCKMGGKVGVVPDSRPETPDNHTEPSAEQDVDRERGATSTLSNLSLHNPPIAKISHMHPRDQIELVHDHVAAPLVSHPDHITKKQRRSDDPLERGRAVPSTGAERNAGNIHTHPPTGLQVPLAAPLSSSTLR